MDDIFEGSLFAIRCGLLVVLMLWSLLVQLQPLLMSSLVKAGVSPPSAAVLLLLSALFSCFLLHYPPSLLPPFLFLF